MSQIKSQSGIQSAASVSTEDPKINNPFAAYKLVRRNGSVVPFEPGKIAVALTKAFIATEGEGSGGSSRIHDIVQKLTQQVVDVILHRQPLGGVIHIEFIQDQVELALMRSGEHEVARRYVLYRESRAQERARAKGDNQAVAKPQLRITMPNGHTQLLDYDRLHTVIEESCAGLSEAVCVKTIFDGTVSNLYDGVAENEVFASAILSARTLIERDPDYAFAAARLLLDQIRREVIGEPVTHAQMSTRYKEYFADFIRTGIEAGLLDSKLAQYDLSQLGSAIKANRDLKFQYLGLQTLYDRYLIHVDNRRIELPQAFWMRVAMGLALNEVDRQERAIQFYEVLSNFDFVSSSPTLFNSGTNRPQLSSCFLTTVSDDLDSIFEGIKENAMLSKFSGGLGNDWTPVRALGAHIKGTNGKSQGVVPFLKVVNDTAVAVNQGGKRKGAVCSIWKPGTWTSKNFWKPRKNTGDDRRRTHDMNTANWVPDLFMERVAQDGQWTLFSPDEVSDLHDLYGQAFRDAYQAYEKLADEGKIKLCKRVSAVVLWRKMLSMLFETGHPWITFKDPCNLRSPQQHVGVVHCI